MRATAGGVWGCVWQPAAAGHTSTPKPPPLATRPQRADCVAPALAPAGQGRRGGFRRKPRRGEPTAAKTRTEPAPPPAHLPRGRGEGGGKPRGRGGGGHHTTTPLPRPTCVGVLVCALLLVECWIVYGNQQQQGTPAPRSLHHPHHTHHAHPKHNHHTHHTLLHASTMTSSISDYDIRHPRLRHIASTTTTSSIPDYDKWSLSASTMPNLQGYGKAPRGSIIWASCRNYYRNTLR